MPVAGAGAWALLFVFDASSIVTIGSWNTCCCRMITTVSQLLQPVNSRLQKNPTKNRPPGTQIAMATGMAAKAKAANAGTGYAATNAKEHLNC